MVLIGVIATTDHMLVGGRVRVQVAVNWLDRPGLGNLRASRRAIGESEAAKEEHGAGEESAKSHGGR